MSAAVSLADRCLDPPENTSRVVGETAGCQGRVSACQWCVPFHGVHTLRTALVEAAWPALGIRECG